VQSDDNAQLPSALFLAVHNGNLALDALNTLLDKDADVNVHTVSLTRTFSIRITFKYQRVQT
jgi:hypothetical protein